MEYSFSVAVFTALACLLRLGSVSCLILTPLIREGLIEKAQNDSKVEIFGVESYSGYFTVNEQYDSNMFFWFFPAEGQPEAPVLLWLNGGPGRSSLYGALLENGPLALNMQGELERRNVSWTESFSMLYIDNPVGTGYSYTRDDQGFSRSMDDVAENLYSALIQFFQMFPQYIDNDFYIGGQSYAGKYIPTLGYFIHNRNQCISPRAEVVIKLKGIYLGGGYCDPIGMMPAFFDYVFNMGVITDAQRQEKLKDAYQFVEKAQSGQIKASVLKYIEEVFQYHDLSMYGLDNMLGSKATWYFLLLVIDSYLASPSTVTMLHAAGTGQPQYNEQWQTVRDRLAPDFLNDTLFHNNFLLRHYKVLHYSGNLDVIVSVPMTEAFLQRLDWPLGDPSGSADTSAQDYRTASRKGWTLNNELAGWYTTVGKLYRVVVRNAGHAVPHDQPARALEMMRRFVAGTFH